MPNKMIFLTNSKNVRHLKPQGARNFTEFVPRYRGIGHLKYHSTSPCIFGKLTSCIIRVELGTRFKTKLCLDHHLVFVNQLKWIENIYPYEILFMPGISYFSFICPFLN